MHKMRKIACLEVGLTNITVTYVCHYEKLLLTKKQAKSGE